MHLLWTRGCGVAAARHLLSAARVKTRSALLAAAATALSNSLRKASGGVQRRRLPQYAGERVGDGAGARAKASGNRLESVVHDDEAILVNTPAATPPSGTALHAQRKMWGCRSQQQPYDQIRVLLLVLSFGGIAALYGQPPSRLRLLLAVTSQRA